MSLVLIVDDEPRIRELLARWLTPAGHEVAEAADAESAIDRMNATPFDVVLCDMQMPGKGGRWLLEQCRARFPQTAIVLATADETVPPFVSLRDGIVDYLVKPFDKTRVLDAVARGVEWRRTAPARPGTPNDDGDMGDPIEQWIRPK